MPSRSNPFLTLAAALPALAVFGEAAVASAPEAWEEFRKAVESSCLAAAAPVLSNPQIVVDPFGSESYGLAFLTGSPTEDNDRQSVVCIYDKAAETAEIGGTMALERAVPELQPDPTVTASVEATPAPAGDQPAQAPAVDAPSAPATLAERLLSPSAATPPAEIAALQAPTTAQSSPADPTLGLFAGQCDATCAVTLGELAESDRVELLDLAAQVRRTIEKDPDASLGEGPAAAREAAMALAASAQGEEAEGISAPTADLAGEGSCVLYYYGYGSEAARTVGTHQCRVSADEGGVLTVEKTSGERLQAEVKPLTDDIAAFMGRTFASGGAESAYDPADAGEGEFGNTVGFAVEDEGRLMLISSQQRRFEAPDDFFWVLAVDAR